MKIVFFLFVCFSIIFSNDQVDVDIKAEKFLADRQKNLVVFTGNVIMQKGGESLNAQKLTVYTKLDENNETVVKKYIASGNVNLQMKKPTTTMIAKGDSIIYDVDTMEYIIEGNGYLEDVNDSKIIRGEKIYLDRKTQKTKIDGGKDKPVQFKFKIEENNNETH